MPALEKLLADSMLFAAAKGLGVEPIVVEGAFAVPPPSPKTEDLDEHTIRNNPIWQWKAEPAAPGVWREVNCTSRGMGMNYSMPVPVLDVVCFRDAQVQREDGSKIDLPLGPDFVIGAWRIVHGKIGRLEHWLWPLAARVDASMCVALAYKLDAGQLVPLPRAEVDDLGDDLMPDEEFSATSLRFRAGIDGDAKICIGPTRYVLVVELVLCKENDDYAPGGMVGMARVHPHALFWSNEKADRFQISLDLRRPKNAMTHGDASMHEQIGALVVTDCNRPSSPATPSDYPLTMADVIYDYYCTDPKNVFEGRDPGPGDHPLQRQGEICMADPRRKRPRTNAGAIVRNMGSSPTRDDVHKEPGQGQFDNIHLAPRMRVPPFDEIRGGEDGIEKTQITLEQVVMLFVCMHDCLHMHVRWAAFASDEFVLGWDGGRPHAKQGAPAVPENQAVFCKIPKDNVLEYRAVAQGVRAGTVQVVCHHGLGYAVEEWPTKVALGLRMAMRTGLEAFAQARAEPYAALPFTWASFYWRFRYGGRRGYTPVERLYCDLEKCMP
jgi:hypothetical protein